MISTDHPTLPLTAVQFSAALRTGHGRVMQHIDAYGPADMADLIVAACVSCVSFDPQCEADRAPWLASLIQRTQLHAEVLAAINAAMRASLNESNRDTDQRTAILRELAAAGLDDARRLLYASLVRAANTADVIGARDIVALDGLDGLVHVARQSGRWLAADPDFWVDADLIERCGDNALAALERVAETDAAVARYLANVHKMPDEVRVPFNATDLTGAEIVAHVTRNPRDQCHWFRRWGAHAASGQRDIVFAALLASREPEHVKRLFRCFAKVALPCFDSGLLQWLFHHDDQVRWAAVRAMAHIEHVEVRNAGLQLLADGDLANGIALLVHNFAAGDFALCAAYLQQPGAAAAAAAADYLHALIGSLLDLCTAHPGADARAMLLYVYALSPCSTCRKQAVQAMVDARSAPAWVLEECVFDAEPAIRALVAG